MSEEPHAIIYFHPGKLIFHARNKPGGINETDKKALLDWANGLAEKVGKGKRLVSFGDSVDFSPPSTSEGEGQRFSVQKQAATAPVAGIPQRERPTGSRKQYKSPEVKVPPPFTLITAQVNGKWSTLPTSTDPDGILRLTQEEQKELKAELDQLLELAYFLDKRRKSAPVQLEVVSLNWRMSVGRPSDPSDTGGPGGKPCPVCEDDINRWKIEDILTTLPGVGSLPDPDRGEGVVVAILDTAYTPDQLKAFYKTWVLDKRASGERVHPIVEALLNDDPAHPGALRAANGMDLRVYLSSSLDGYMEGVEIDGHDYDMTDHGLFVAGIINSIAPKAELHLYQVLNKYGVGDLESITGALKAITKNLQGRKLVVNLSLTMNMPLNDEYLKPHDDWGMGRSILSYRPSFLMRLFCRFVCWVFEYLLHLPCPGFCESWFDRQTRPFEYVCDLIYALDSRVIAAAGNESKKGARLRALYPAAMDRVFGVGALARDGSPASYSNLADQPASVGITTLGGEPGARRGILGVYLGKFPEDNPPPPSENKYGLAWWCGTSFATPIITGITAAVLGSIKTGTASILPGPRTEDAIARLYDVALPPEDSDDEFSLTVGQS